MESLSVEPLVDCSHNQPNAEKGHLASCPGAGGGKTATESICPPPLSSCQPGFQAGWSPSPFAQPATCARAKGTDEAIAAPAPFPPGSAGPSHRFVTAAPGEGNSYWRSKASSALKTPWELALGGSATTISETHSRSPIQHPEPGVGGNWLSASPPSATHLKGHRAAPSPCSPP